jgi:uncharacterized protein YdiU (UPF0061 family)
MIWFDIIIRFDSLSCNNSLIIARKRIKSNNNIKSNHFLKEKYNPAIIPRNHIVEKYIREAENNKFNFF